MVSAFLPWTDVSGPAFFLPVGGIARAEETFSLDEAHDEEKSSGLQARRNLSVPAHELPGQPGRRPVDGFLFLLPDAFPVDGGDGDPVPVYLRDAPKEQTVRHVLQRGLRARARRGADAHALFPEHRTLRPVDHPPVSAMVEECLHRARGMEHVDGAGEDDDVRGVHRGRDRRKLAGVRTVRLAPGKTGVASGAELVEIFGQEELRNLSAGLLRDFACNMIRGAFVALSMYDDDFHVDDPVLSQSLKKADCEEPIESLARS